MQFLLYRVSKSEREKEILYIKCIYMESRKIVLMILRSGQEQRCRHREQTCGCSEGEHLFNK